MGLSPYPLGGVPRERKGNKGLPRCQRTGGSEQNLEGFSRSAGTRAPPAGCLPTARAGHPPEARRQLVGGRRLPLAQEARQVGRLVEPPGDHVPGAGAPAQAGPRPPSVVNGGGSPRKHSPPFLAPPGLPAGDTARLRSPFAVPLARGVVPLARGVVPLARGAFPWRGASCPWRGAPFPSRGAPFPSRGAPFPSRGAPFPSRGGRSPHEGRRAPHEGRRSPGEVADRVRRIGPAQQTAH